MFTVGSKGYAKHHRTCHILIIFRYLMMSKVIYLLNNEENLINCLH